MKRLLMYLVVAVVLISVGFSVYYVVRDDEEIYSLVDDNQIFYINQGETLNLPVVWEDPASTSEFKITSSGYESYVSINLEDWTITGENAGLFELTFATTNDKFAGQTFSVNCYVGNGSTNFPFYVRDEQDLRKIGHDNWSLSANYQLVNDIALTQPFTPIGLIENDGVWSASEFNGSFSGGAMRHKISNVKIEDFPYPTVGFFVKVGEFGRVENVVFVFPLVSEPVFLVSPFVVLHELYEKPVFAVALFTPPYQLFTHGSFQPLQSFGFLTLPLALETVVSA